MKLLIGFLICFSLGFSAAAQQLDDIRIDGLYLGTLDKVLDEISVDTGVKFSFDREKLSKYKFESRLFELPMSDFLNQVGRRYHIKYFQDANGTVNLLDQYTLVDEKVISARPMESKKQFLSDSIRSNLTVTGSIKDKITGESLPFVSLQIRGANYGTSANVDGYFSLLNVPSDTATIVVQCLGYDPTIIQLTPETKMDNIIIEMDQAAVRLDAVVVSSQKQLTTAAFQSNERTSMIKMIPSRITDLPNAGERDILRSFQLMPGVSAANENSAGLYARGGTPDQSLVVYDGFTVYHVDHLFGFYSAFNYNAIKDVQLYKGGFESKFGGRISSVAEITSKEGNQRQVNVGGDLSLLSLNLFGEFPVGEKLTIVGAARTSYQGSIYSRIFDNIYGTAAAPVSGIANGAGTGSNFSNFGTTTGSYFYDLNSKVTYRPSDKDVISWSVYNGTDDMDNSRKLNSKNFFANANTFFNTNINDRTKWGNTGTSLKWSRRWNSKWYTNALVSYSNYFSHRDRTNETTVERSTGAKVAKVGLLENNNLTDYSFKFDTEYKLNAKNDVEFGALITKYDIRYLYSLNDTTSIINRINTGFVYTGYVQDKISLMNNKLTVIPGLRYNYYDVTKGTYAEPRLSITYQLNNRVKIKGATGLYYQFAKRVVREDISQGSRDFWTLSDDSKVPISYANHFILGASYETDLFIFDVEAYYKQLYGLSEYTLRATPSFGKLTYNESFYLGTGETRGVDFLVQKKSGAYNGWIGYTLSQTTNTFPVYQAKPYLANQNVTHEFKSINLYKYRHWEFSVTFIYASGKPYTAPDGEYTQTLLDGTTKNFTSVGAKNSLQLPNYHRMDAAITYHWTSGRGAANSVGLSFFNLYDHKNIWYKNYQVVNGQLVETNVYYLGFTPNLTMSWKLK